MKRDITLWQWAGFAATSLGGTLLHYLYEWTGEQLWIAPFSGVNESVWEHMKLLFFPLFIFACIQGRFWKDLPNFWCIKLVGTMVGLLLIPTIYYLYNGAFGKSPDWLNISIFFVAAAATFWLENRLFQRQDVCRLRPALARGILWSVAVVFAVLTFVPPDIPLFKDPVTGTKGIL